MNPLLWLDAIISAPSLLSLPLLPLDLRPWFLATAFIPPAVTLIAYIYWTFKDPDRIQSEGYALEQKRLSLNPLMGDNTTQQVIEAPSSGSLLTSNSAALPGGPNG
nr:hypothetical protein [uncultured Sphingomonas sp.]